MAASFSPARPRRSAIIGLVVIIARVDRLRHLQRRRRAQGGRLGDRAGRQPQAVLRRRDPRRPTPRACPADGACSCSPSSSWPCRCTGCSSPAGRPVPQEGWDNRFASWGSQLFAPTAEGGFNCAGCHGGMQAVGGEAPFTVTDPHDRQIEAVNWKAPALNTVVLPVQRRRGPLHPQLRPARSRRCRRGVSSAAAR